jgi:uncharacterized protein YxjI
MGLLGKGKVKFQMRQDLLSIGDDFWIENDDGHKAYRVDGAALRLRDHFSIVDATGTEVATIKERKLGRDKMVIELAGGRKVTVKKALLGVRDRFSIDVEDGRDLHATGNLVDHEYEISKDGIGGKVAEVSKKWFRVRDTYGVEMDADQDPAMILAITVAIDALNRA